nr:MAG TPA: hypothetical protein [Caudoviricetes sp.]
MVSDFHAIFLPLIGCPFRFSYSLYSVQNNIVHFYIFRYHQYI